jgi:hypothetical protein
VPHLHAPLVHESARNGLHAVHAAPPVPQVEIDGVLHVEPEQQPVGHVVEQPVQTPALQLLPPPHAAHAAPPEPHATSLLPGSQMLPAQHPLGQLVPLHTQAPPTHA